MNKILLIEDNLALLRTLHDVFPRENYLTQTARSLAHAYLQLAQKHYDLLIIDRHLPDGDGLEIAEHIHRSCSDTPILMLTDLNSVTDRVSGLRKGADDYLGKPFSTEELLLRAEKLVRKIPKTDTVSGQLGKIHLFADSGVVRIGLKKVHLRKREFGIFTFLVRHKNMLVSRQMLIDNLWPENEAPTQKTLDVYVRRIRLLLGKERWTVQTIRGYGYMARDRITPRFKMR